MTFLEKYSKEIEELKNMKDIDSSWISSGGIERRIFLSTVEGGCIFRFNKINNNPANKIYSVEFMGFEFSEESCKNSSNIFTLL